MRVLLLFCDFLFGSGVGLFYLVLYLNCSPMFCF